MLGGIRSDMEADEVLQRVDAGVDAGDMGADGGVQRVGADGEAGGREGVARGGIGEGWADV